MLFYTLIDPAGKISYSPVPEVDKLLTGGTVVSDGSPLEILYRKYQNDPIRTDWKKGIVNKGHSRSELLAPVNKTELRENNSGKVEAKTASDLQCLEDEKLFNSFLMIIRGRQIAAGDFAGLRQHLKVDELTLLMLMQKAVIREFAGWVPALGRTGRTWRCERCGSQNCWEWPSVFGEAATCQDCKSIGALTSLQVLFRAKSSDRQTSDSQTGLISEPVVLQRPDKAENPLEAGAIEEGNFDYTPDQRRVARKLIDFCQDNKTKEILIWAACGAGKTEVCFPVIENTLREKKYVLFAAPRQDVVHDVHHRLQQYFSAQKVTLLSGAVAQDFQPAPITVATTHQVLRFYKAFDLVVFDEIDAYPYTANHILAYGLQQAMKDSGKMISLTATPSEEDLLKCRRGECVLLRLAKRFHGYPLPVPEWLKLRVPEVKTMSINELQSNRHFRILFTTFNDLSSIGPLLIFVPTVELVKVWIGIVNSVIVDKRIDGSWSNDPERRNKVAAFLKGEIDIFVCTSILERGVTVDNVQVAVLYADHALYDTRSLVQMAGRTGRTQRCPTGRAVFVAAKKTKDMATAIDWIMEQNAIGRGE